MTEGTPLHGDRSAWNTTDFADEHARDINDSALLRHLPAPTTANDLIQSDGTNWVTVTAPTFEGAVIIDVTSTEALLVRKNADGGDVLVVDTTNGRVGINMTPTVPLQITRDDYTEVYIDTYHTSAPVEATLKLRKARGTKASPSAVVDNDSIGVVHYLPYINGDFRHAALIRAEVEGTPSATSYPVSLVFETTIDGSTTRTERMRITDNIAIAGNLGVISAPVTNMAVKAYKTGFDASAGNFISGYFNVQATTVGANELYGAQLLSTISGAGNQTAGVFGVKAGIVNTSTAVITVAYATLYEVDNQSTGNISVAYGNRTQLVNRSTATIADWFGVFSFINQLGAGTVGNAYQFYASSPNNPSGTINNLYGLYVEAQTAGGTNYAIYTNSGQVRFGDYTTIDQASATGAQPVLLLDQGDVSEQLIKGSYSGADVDMIIIELDVGGAPKLGWSETPDVFTLNKGLAVGDGGTTNYANFAGDGELTLFGTARTNQSVDVEPGLTKRPASNPPGEGTEDNFLTHDFNAATDESVFFHWEIPHDYASAGTIHIHFDFFVDTAPAGEESVVWGVEYKKQSVGDNFDFSAGTTTAYTQESITTGTPANDKKIHRSSAINLTVTGFEPGDFVLLRFFRDANGTGGTDDYTADARIVDYHIEYIADKLGETT